MGNDASHVALFLEDLAGIYVAGREGPAADLGLVAALPEDDATVLLDDDADRDLRVVEADVAAARAGRPRPTEGEALLQGGAALRTEGSHGARGRAGRAGHLW